MSKRPISGATKRSSSRTKPPMAIRAFGRAARMPSAASDAQRT